MTGNSIQVGRLECRYFAPRDLPQPELLRSQLDEVFERDFPAALSAAFPQSFPPDSDGLWLIRRLDLSLDTSGDWNPGQLARIWAGLAARTIVESMFSRDSGANVLYFPHPSAYLAQFVTDVAQGDAWSKWYYRSFAGLRLLASADALASALTRDRDLSLQALGHIAPAGFRRILSALLAQHAEMVWRRLAPAHAVPAKRSAWPRFAPSGLKEAGRRYPRSSIVRCGCSTLSAASVESRRLMASFPRFALYPPSRKLACCSAPPRMKICSLR
jgi:hypothetical protein